MTYANLSFPKLENRPYYYSNFVQTLDGKVGVADGKDYWPIGSPTDYATLVELRAHADVLIHGKTTALDHPTLVSLEKSEFTDQRSRLGKTIPLAYVVVAGHPEADLTEKLTSAPRNGVVILATLDEAPVPNIPSHIEVWRCGKESVDLHLLSRMLKDQGYDHGLVEGGPHLMGEFVKTNLIDEVFMTIAPKIFGSDKSRTVSMVEGYLNEPAKVPSYRLRETHQINDELFLRYVKSV